MKRLPAVCFLFSFMFALALVQAAFSGTFYNAELYLPEITVLHPMGYTGTGDHQILEITVGIDPSSDQAVDAQFSALNVVNTWNALTPSSTTITRPATTKAGTRQRTSKDGSYPTATSHSKSTGQPISASSSATPA